MRICTTFLLILVPNFHNVKPISLVNYVKKNYNLIRWMYVQDVDLQNLGSGIPRTSWKRDESIYTKKQHFCKMSCDVSMYGCGLSYLMAAIIAVIIVETSAVAELIICTIDIQKADYIGCHRCNIGILALDPESTWKTSPGDVQYVTFQCGFICPIFGNNHCICSSKDQGPDMMVPTSDFISLWNFASFDK